MDGFDAIDLFVAIDKCCSMYVCIQMSSTCGAAAAVVIYVTV